MIPNDENTTDGMVEILNQMHEYVPTITSKSGNEETGLFPLAMGGDMLTAARARTAQDVRVTCHGKEALRGLYPFPADWHAKVNFMEVRIYIIFLYCALKNSSYLTVP